MTKKEKFIEFVKVLMEGVAIDLNEWEDAIDFWNAFQITEDKEKSALTEKGIAILKFAQDNETLYKNLFKAKDIGAGIQVSSRAVSGSLRKLVTDGYFEKIGESPAIYSLTAKGKEATWENSES